MPLWTLAAKECHVHVSNVNKIKRIGTIARNRYQNGKNQLIVTRFDGTIKKCSQEHWKFNIFEQADVSHLEYPVEFIKSLPLLKGRLRHTQAGTPTSPLSRFDIKKFITPINVIMGDWNTNVMTCLTGNYYQTNQTTALLIRQSSFYQIIFNTVWNSQESWIICANYFAGTI